FVVNAGLSVDDGVGVGVAAGFFAAVGALDLGASFAGGGFAGGCAAGGVSEICAKAPVAMTNRPASSDMGRRSFMSGVIRARPGQGCSDPGCPCLGCSWLFRTRLRALARLPVRHRSAPPLRRADRPR